MSRFTDLIGRLENFQTQGNWPGVLVEITNAVIALVQDAQAKAVVFGSPEIDRHCLAAGALASASLGASPETAFDDGLVVYFATSLMKNAGGHTLALRDAIQARPQSRHVILVTNLHNQVLAMPDFVDANGGPVQLIVAPEGNLAQKALWLIMALRQLRPGRLMLFNHHYDSATIAAAQPGAARETLYFHHCDHDMALGLYLPHAKHIDCTNIVHERCRTQLGVHEPRYWPLVSADLGARAPAHPYLAAERGLVTCSHGTYIKFTSPGRYNYFDLIVRRLKELPGIHRHLGALPESNLSGLRQALQDSGVDPARFQHALPVPSLWQWLLDSDVDIVISSFPVQGAKGLVETMGAGMPVLMHESAVSKLHSTLDLVYSDVLRWRTPDELLAVLHSLDAGALRAQSQAARTHYECWHHPRELAYAVNNPRLTAPLPPTYPAVMDTLALYWR